MAGELRVQQARKVMSFATSLKTFALWWNFENCYKRSCEVVLEWPCRLLCQLATGFTYVVLPARMAMLKWPCYSVSIATEFSFIKLLCFFSTYNANTRGRTVGLTEQCWASATQGSLFVSIKLENIRRNMIESKKNGSRLANYTRAMWPDRTMCVGINTSSYKCSVATGEGQTSENC